MKALALEDINGKQHKDFVKKTNSTPTQTQRQLERTKTLEQAKAAEEKLLLEPPLAKAATHKQTLNESATSNKSAKKQRY